jgi:lactoylglutathione lyase
LALGHGVHKVEIDLMQPIDATKSPKVQTPALNHIGLWVDNIEKAVETLTAQGLVFTPGGIRKGAGKEQKNDCFSLLCLTVVLCVCCSWL